MRLSISLVGWLLFCSLLTARAQSNYNLSMELSRVSGSNAANYLSPLLSALGSDLNSAFFHSADLHEILGFDICVKIGGAFVKDEDKVFDIVLPDKITYFSQGVPFILTAGVDYDRVVPGSPTAVGSWPGNTATVKSTSPFIPLRGQRIFTAPNGLYPYVPLMMPQAAIGLPYGFEVMGRFVPSFTLPNQLGKVKAIGFGIRHSIDQYFPLMPVNVAVHFVSQKLTLTDMSNNKIAGTNAYAYGVEVSKTLMLLTIYAGYQLEKSSWTVEPYSTSDLTSSVSFTAPGFTFDGKNTSRFLTGARVLLGLVSIHLDYSFAAQPAIAVGAGISVR